MLFAYALPAIAQDMPLSQVLIDGEGWKVADTGMPKPADMKPFRVPEVDQPTCQALSRDGGTLFVGSAVGRYVWAFRVNRDGTLSAGQPYCSLRVPPKTKSTSVAALAVDSDDRIYAVTPLGVQIFDPTGRLCGVLTKPTNEPLVGIAFGGSDGHSLYLASKTAVYVRKVKSQGLGFAKAK